jgi:transposase
MWPRGVGSLRTLLPLVNCHSTRTVRLKKSRSSTLSASNSRPWLTVYRLPPYAHELNPVEPVWSHLKRSSANLTKHTIAELTVLVKPG